MIHDKELVTRRARLRRPKEESTTTFPLEPTYTGVKACTDAWIKYVKADAKVVEKVRSIFVAFFKDYPTTDNPQAALQWSNPHFACLSIRNYTSYFITIAFETASIECDGYPRARSISEVKSTSFNTSIHTFKDGEIVDDLSPLHPFNRSYHVLDLDLLPDPFCSIRPDQYPELSTASQPGFAN